MEIGDFVVYNPGHCVPELGRVKSFSSFNNNPFVVYNCNGDWGNYEDYTGANTDRGDLIVIEKRGENDE